MRFKFGVPEHGWMNVSVIDDERVVTLDISDVPCDSIDQLASALLSLQKGSPEEDVEFSLEPEYARCVVVK